MDPKAKYTLVGAVVAVLLVLIVAAILWLSEAGGLRHAKYYTIYFRQHTLSGLQVDSAVTMRGIKVGSVASLEISRRNIERVRVVITLDPDTPIKTNTVAIINRNLLTGFASLDLARGTQDAPPLVEAPPGQDYPIIPEAKNELEQLTDTLPDLLDKVGQIASRFHSLLSDENVTAISETLKNVEQLTASLADNKEKLDSVIRTIETSAEEFAKISKTLDTFANNNDRRLARVSDEFVASLQELRTTIADFHHGSSDLISSLSGTAQLLSQQIGVIAQNVSQTAESISRTFEAYEQPRTLFSGPPRGALGPGEEERK
jgi:phospholipid/cholesterol/gamma-HCH transport system substrate-binding protein